jgi:hypothetical protein
MSNPTSFLTAALIAICAAGVSTFQTEPGDLPVHPLERVGYSAKTWLPDSDEPAVLQCAAKAGRGVPASAVAGAAARPAADAGVCRLQARRPVAPGCANG